jgi:hypothetical protein
MAFLPILTNAISLLFTLTGANRVFWSGNVVAHAPGFYVEPFAHLPIYVFAVILGYLDSRELKRRGVPYPFAWGWAFFDVVYVIGRAVVVRRRTGKGLAPLWVYIAVVVATGAASIALTAGTVLN